jgi:hypothetical protein
VPIKTESVRKLADMVGEFHLRNGAMHRAQRRIVALLDAGDQTPHHEIVAYIEQVGAYFTAFEHEARVHLKDVEKRLSHISQLQFNLTAERGVAVRRIEITQGVLAALKDLKP